MFVAYLANWKHDQTRGKMSKDGAQTFSNRLRCSRWSVAVGLQQLTMGGFLSLCENVAIKADNKPEFLLETEKDLLSFRR